MAWIHRDYGMSSLIDNKEHVYIGFMAVDILMDKKVGLCKFDKNMHTHGL